VAVIFLVSLMMLPMVAGAYTFYLSQQAVEGKFDK